MKSIKGNFSFRRHSRVLGIIFCFSSVVAFETHAEELFKVCGTYLMGIVRKDLNLPIRAVNETAAKLAGEAEIIRIAEAIGGERGRYTPTVEVGNQDALKTYRVRKSYTRGIFIKFTEVEVEAFDRKSAMAIATAKVNGGLPSGCEPHKYTAEIISEE